MSFHAERFIQLFHEVENPMDEQHLLLAEAHFTLANQVDRSLSHCRFHANSAVAILQNIQNKAEAWQSQIAEAYFRRAELLEEEKAYFAAACDYQRAIEAIEPHLKTDETKVFYRQNLSDQNKLMLSKCAISIADLIIHDQIDHQPSQHTHPLFYINKALEYLKSMAENNEEIFAIAAYAHQLAGIVLNISDFDAAQSALQEALSLAFKSNSDTTYYLLTDIYNCFGLLYEDKFQNQIIRNPEDLDLEAAMIYFSIALLFTKTVEEEADEDENLLGLESLFEIIYRALDPFLPPLPKSLLINLIDSLIFAYRGIIEDDLPNEYLKELLNQTPTLDMFAQHIYWLVMEAERKHSMSFSLTVFDPNMIDNHVDKKQVMSVIKNNVSKNVLDLQHFKRKRSKAISNM